MNIENLGLIMLLVFGKKMLLVLAIWGESVKLGKSYFIDSSTFGYSWNLAMQNP